MNNERNLKTKKIVVAVIAIAIGICAIIFAFCLKLYGGYILYEYYGGDAYTGIQHAAADTGNNVYWLEVFMRRVFRYAFILTGLGFIFYGLKTLLLSDVNIAKVADTNTVTSGVNNNETNLDRLATLKDLFDKGVIDENEFKAEKEKMLNHQ